MANKTSPDRPVVLRGRCGGVLGGRPAGAVLLHLADSRVDLVSSWERGPRLGGEKRNACFGRGWKTLGFSLGFSLVENQAHFPRGLMLDFRRRELFFSKSSAAAASCFSAPGRGKDFGQGGVLLILSKGRTGRSSGPSVKIMFRGRNVS